MDGYCEVSCLAQKAYPDFPDQALDQVSENNSLRDLS